MQPTQTSQMTLQRKHSGSVHRHMMTDKVFSSAGILVIFMDVNELGSRIPQVHLELEAIASPLTERILYWLCSYQLGCLHCHGSFSNYSSRWENSREFDLYFREEGYERFWFYSANFLQAKWWENYNKAKQFV